jgi:3-oxoacyl-[acyl-carrier-protein] synthase II
MADGSRDVLITGIGIMSCLGEGPEAHWQGLASGRPTADAERFAPYVVHPLGAIDFDRQIPKKGDQRQMEPWQRIGTYAAGLALDSAGLKGNAELLARTDLIVAAGGGERDCAVDSGILTEIRSAPRPEAFLNERLMSGLRPTLFLAQLSNLLAGNISIVHGVTGSSRTFMGEEAAGIDALRVAAARIAAGQSDIGLVGGAQNAERADQILVYESGGHALKVPFAPVFARGPRGGMALGSLGAFLVLEAAEHARRRGAPALARLSRVLCEHTRRRDGDVTAALETMWQKLEPSLRPGRFAILSGASGAGPATSEEEAFLRRHATVPVRETGTVFGHGVEAQFAMNVAVATLALRHRQLYASTPGANDEPDMKDALTQVVVTGVGHWRGEGMALVEAVE